MTSETSPPPAPAPRSPANLLLLLLKIGLGVAVLLVLIFAALVAYVKWEKGKYSQLTDTRDLRQHVGRMAGEYLAKHTNGALVVAVVQRGRRHTLGIGRRDGTNAVPPDAETLFEIGSITKVFTGICLACQSLDGAVRLDDTLRQRLPAEVTLPPNLEPLTLLQLATHTAGLPRLPDNLDLSPKNAANPYAHYTATNLYQYLAQARLKHPPGKVAEYSNVGFGLLGHLLTLRAGKPYEQLVTEAVCQPLGLSNTVITLTDAQRQRLAPGHSPKGDLVPNWDFAVIAPAGALRSCATDLLKFVEANLAPTDTPVGRALRESQRARLDAGLGAGGLGWQHTTTIQGDLKIIWHNGGTGGYRSFLGFDPAHQTGVVVLSNYGDAFAGDESVDRLGMEILKLASKVTLE